MMALSVVGAVYCAANGLHTDTVVGVNVAIILFFILRIDKKQRDEY